MFYATDSLYCAHKKCVVLIVVGEALLLASDLPFGDVFHKKTPQQCGPEPEAGVSFR
jgi:hypothetical protein